jgi:diguanylate cyclase (GGDEF)-like protein
MQQTVRGEQSTEGSAWRRPLRKVGLAAGGAGAIGLVWWLDELTGPELAFSVFYMLPVAVVVWLGGEVLGIGASVLAALAWYAADAGRAYSQPSMHLYNSLVRLAVFLVVAGLLARLRRARDLERALARTDPLTECANTRAFYGRLEHEIKRSQRTQHPLGLVYVDVDDFKLVNDRHGHLVGDNLLQVVARTAHAEVRATDMVARLGGDEFAILLVDTEADSIQRVGHRLRSALLAEMGQHGWPVTFSFGVATFVDPPAGVHEAIQVVDELTYGVKREGKNGVALRTVAVGDAPATRLGRARSAGRSA